MSTGSLKPGSPPESRVDDPYVGRVVSDRYRILRKLGEGGMGVVYLAEHVVIEKKVALKILSEELARKGDLVIRFMQEAKAASRIGHENIVDITDFGQTEAGSVFIAMEYLEGADLATIIREQGPLPFTRVRSIANQICRGLGAAHDKGIIHRDIKPENIFIVPREGRPDFVKILDFGIAKMSSVDEVGERLTGSGMIFGTPEYMSPEQARGERPDHRVDLYAVGCIVYEMLTGDVPFHAETMMGVLTKHMFEPPESPSTRVPAAMITPEVDAVVMRALAKNRDERYRTMRELALALAAVDGGDVATAWDHEGATPGAKASADAVQESPARKTRLLWATVGVIALVAAGIAVRPRREPPPVREAPVVVAPTPPPSPPPPDVPKTQCFVLEVRPANARVLLGDEVVRPIAPDRYELPYGKTKVTLRLEREGYVDNTIELTPDHDGTYRKELVPASPHRARSRDNAKSLSSAAKK